MTDETYMILFSTILLIVNGIVYLIDSKSGWNTLMSLDLRHKISYGTSVLYGVAVPVLGILLLWPASDGVKAIPVLTRLFVLLAGVLCFLFQLGATLALRRRLL